MTKVTTADLGEPPVVKAMEIEDARDRKAEKYVALLRDAGISARRAARIGADGGAVLGKVRNLRAPSRVTWSRVVAALRASERAGRMAGQGDRGTASRKAPRIHRARAASSPTLPGHGSAVRPALSPTTKGTIMGRQRTNCEQGDYPKPGKTGTPRGLAMHMARVHGEAGPGRNGVASVKQPRVRKPNREARFVAVVAEVLPAGIQSVDDLRLFDDLRERIQ